MKPLGVLYKYRQCNEHAFKILENGEIYMPSISKFNDPYEGAIPYIFDSEKLSLEDARKYVNRIAEKEGRCMTKKELERDALEYYKKLSDPMYSENDVQQTRDDVDHRFGILCLSSEKNNFLMWSHYADNHKGMCIGFDTEILNKKIQGALGEIEYQKEIPKKSLEVDAEEFMRKLLFIKSDLWEYEKEWRFAKMYNANDIIKIPFEGIKEVIFGCKMSNDNKEKVLKIVEEKHLNCEIFETSLSKTKFELDIKQIH